MPRKTLRPTNRASQIFSINKSAWQCSSARRARTSTGYSPTRSEHLTPTPKPSPTVETEDFTAGTFTGTLEDSTVTFNSATQSTLTGATTFYALRALTPHTTLYFTAGATQYVNGLVDLENISLRSTTNNATWYFAYAGSSQTILNVRRFRIPTPIAGSTLLPNSQSIDGGNNHNWSFGSNVRYWARSVASNWNLTTSWSYSSGGSAGAPVPRLHRHRDIQRRRRIFNGQAECRRRRQRRVAHFLRIQRNIQHARLRDYCFQRAHIGAAARSRSPPTPFPSVEISSTPPVLDLMPDLPRSRSPALKTKILISAPPPSST